MCLLIMTSRSARPCRHPQVRGLELYASSIGTVNPTAWRLAFTSYDANNDAYLDLNELTSLLHELRMNGGLPQATLTSDAESSALAALHDTNGDMHLGFDEYMMARPGGWFNETAKLPDLPHGWSAGCSFGPSIVTGIAGWTDAARPALAPAGLDVEWITCVTPTARDARADLSLQQHFDQDGSLAGWKVLAVSSLPEDQVDGVSTAKDVTSGPCVHLWIRTMLLPSVLRSKVEPSAAHCVLGCPQVYQGYRWRAGTYD